VHLVPHPEPVTLPRVLDVQDVVFKVGYPADETQRIRVLLELGFDRDEPFEVDGVRVSPRRFAAGYIGSRGIGPDERSANVKQVNVDGLRDGRPVTIVYDFAVEQVGRSASSAITGTVAAVAADLVARGGDPGVYPPEAAFDPRAFVDALATRGLRIDVREVERPEL
jgi:saccharopine dehydrogenase-like NADP-dependent oxidoreductase